MKRCAIFAFITTVSLTLAISVAAAAAEQQTNPSQPAEQPDDVARQQQPPARMVTMDELEEHPERYLNQRVTVRAEVEEVLGPRVFKIDEANWADLDRELLVVMDPPLAALVKEDDPVTITGTLRRYVDVRLDREWGWLDVNPELEARIKTRPVLAAASIFGSNPDAGLFVAIRPASATGGASGESKAGARTTATGATGTSGKSPGEGGRPPLTDVGQLARAADNSLVGRSVNLSSVRIARTVKNGGFWVSTGGEDLFVLPADDTRAVQAGQTVTIEGHVLRLPEQMESRLEKKAGVGNEEIYVYASTVR